MQSRSSETSRRRFLITLSSVALALCGSMSQGAWAKTPFPDKPLRIVVPFSAGSGADIFARYIGKKLGSILEQSVVVTNRPGADGAIAVRDMESEPADGYTILMGTNTPMAANVATMKNMPYDAVNDVIPIYGITRTMAVLVVPEDSPLKSLKDLETHTSSLNMGIYSVSYQLAAAPMGPRLRQPIQMVTYKGLSQTVTDLIGERLDLAFIDSPGAVPLVKSGKVRALAVTGESRHAEMPDVPTLAESGYADSVHYGWTALWVLAKTPADRVAALETAMQTAMNDAETKDFIKTNAAEPMPYDAARMRKFQADEIARFRRAVQTSNYELR